MMARSSRAADPAISQPSSCPSKRPVNTGQMGLLGEPTGTYMTIEGIRAPDPGENFDSQIFLVDTVNSKKLDQPVGINITNEILPEKQRCVVSGYETGKWLGIPPEVYQATPEADRGFLRYERMPWHFYHYFCVVSIKSPEIKTPVIKSYMGWLEPFSVTSSSNPVQMGQTGKPIGTYLTVEGVLRGSGSMDNPRTLTIDSINGDKLNKPVGVAWQCAMTKAPPLKEHLILKGYETGEWAGVPPEAESVLAQKHPGYIGPQAVWQFAIRFVITSAIQPG
jgi:hypothetical protein